MNVSVKMIQAVVGLVFLPAVAFSQHDGEPSRDTVAPSEDSLQAPPGAKQKAPSDTIYLFNQEKRAVNVMKITYDSVIYRRSNIPKLHSIAKERVKKIRYSRGRLDIINDNPPQKKSSVEWREVEFLKHKDEAKGMSRVKRIHAKAQGSGRGFETPKSLEIKAKTILRKKAANDGGRYILITNKTITTAFGEIPSATITGIAYKKEDKKGE